MRGYRIPLLFFLVLALVALIFFSSALDSQGVDDFVVYWSAARLLATGGNPYDPIALQTLQKQAFSGRDDVPGLAFASWNPPWLLLLLLPLGFLPFFFAVRLMFLINLGLIAFAVLWSWRWLVTDRLKSSGAVIALLLAVFFPGSLMTLAIGQISTVVLFFLLLGLWLLNQRRDFLAGVCFFFSIIKPQLVYFVLLAVGLWVLRERRWRVMLGGVIGLAFTLLVFTFLRPSWLADYLGLVGGHVFTQYTTSTLGGVLQAWFGTTLGRYAGVLLLPLVPWIFRLADEHGWLTAMNVSLLFSIPLAPYGFGFDLIVLVPVIVQLIAWLWTRCLKPMRRWIIVVGLLAFYGFSLWLLSISGVPYHFFAWIPLWLGGLYAIAWSECSEALLVLEV
ncbi:MAG: glycosyltransferase 87 family protein [Anaerolineae bacterium]|jgi:hypothetical protein|nr:glycosyltransferase 87 family protein [Anaerolineae bacterium]